MPPWWLGGSKQDLKQCKTENEVSPDIGELVVTVITGIELKDVRIIGTMNPFVVIESSNGS